jgi:hypothetical protein
MTDSGKVVSLPFIIRLAPLGGRKPEYVEIAGVDVTVFVSELVVRRQLGYPTKIEVEFINVTVNERKGEG